MKLDELRALADPEGFRPFTIHTKGGLRMEVPHSDFVAIPPGDNVSFVNVWTTRPAFLRFIDLDAIDHIEFKE